MTKHLRAFSLFFGLVVVFAFPPAGRAVDTNAPAVAKPALKTWVYEARSSRDPGVAVVKDADALDGEALECPATTNTWTGWYTFTSGYTTDYAPGEYEIRFRLKTADNTRPISLFGVGIENGGVWEHPRATDFKAPGKYQEFVYAFTISQPVLNLCVCRREAGPTVWIDRITVVQKRVFTDVEQLQKVGYKRAVNPRLIPHEGTNVWFAKGLYYPLYGLHTAIEKSGAKVSYAHVVRGQRGSALAGAPLDGDSLMRSDLIVLCDVDVECFSPKQRALIADFVAAGGRLLVVGGPFSLGRGQWDQSELLSPLLPVTLRGECDLQPLAEPTPLRPRKGNVLTSGLAWEQQPRVLWVHKTTPREGATVELMAGDVPGLVTWSYGKGRVAVLTVTVLGKVPPPQIPFWEWPDWPKLMTNLAQWLQS